jgi:HK97 family phage prohead protease
VKRNRDCGSKSRKSPRKDRSKGLLSPYGNVDATGDVVEPGAYTKTLKDRGNKIPLLWQHRRTLPIGELTLEERPDGLWCKGQLLMADCRKRSAPIC